MDAKKLVATPEADLVMMDAPQIKGERTEVGS